MRIRRANEGDWDDIAAADRVCFPADDPPECGPGAVWWVAEHDGEIAAYCAAQRAATTPGAAFLSRAGVLPDYRGHSLQRRLVRVRERWARAQGLTSVVTYTYANAPSGNTLIACGYRLFTPERPWSAAGACYWFKTL